MKKETQSDNAALNAAIPDQYLPPSDRQMKAFTDIVHLLKPLDNPVRCRVIRSACILLDISL